MSIRIRQIDLNVVELRTRIPFKFGITIMTAAPHLFVRAEVEVDGKVHAGVAADVLPPKWLTKNPKTTIPADLIEMAGIIESARHHALEIGNCQTVYEFWQKLYEAQKQSQSQHPPLLWHFGVSLMERAVIDAYCRAKKVRFHDAVRNGSLGFTDTKWLPEKPLRKAILRHTVGLLDPLSDADIPAAERVNDGLPQSLEASIETYGLTHFKIKLSGKVDSDRQRLREIAKILAAKSPSYRFTLDGNENFHDLAPFKDLWESLNADDTLRGMMSRVIFVEQPIHRDVALSDQTKAEMLDWVNRPPMIIDESDGNLGDVERALECGYNGTSHKNCKGVFKGLTNAAFLSRATSDRKVILSGEDLTNIGPVAMLQDLTVMATLGIEHVERNGHHYFAGLNAFPQAVQEQALAANGDLYHRHEQGYAALTIRNGSMEIGSVVDAPFGVGSDFDSRQFTPMHEWKAKISSTT